MLSMLAPMLLFVPVKKVVSTALLLVGCISFQIKWVLTALNPNAFIFAKSALVKIAVEFQLSSARKWHAYIFIWWPLLS